jgi:hypothetical protein
MHISQVSLNGQRCDVFIPAFNILRTQRDCCLIRGAYGRGVHELRGCRPHGPASLRGGDQHSSRALPQYLPQVHAPSILFLIGGCLEVRTATERLFFLTAVFIN